MLSILEVVVVDFRDADGLVTYGDAMVHHERGELVTIDENDAAARFDGGLAGVFGEVAGGDEDAFGGALELECAHEALDLGAPDDVLPAFGLDVDLLEAEAIEGDDTVDAAVAGATDTLQIGAAGPVGRTSVRPCCCS